MDVNDDESEWDHLNRTHWRGLGLTDPIKSVEVRPFSCSDHPNDSLFE